MKKDYIISNQELAERGLDLEEYALSGVFVPALINRGLDICITRCCYLNDDFKGEKDIEKALDENEYLLGSFKKLQFNVLWNLIFTAEDNPVDLYVDTIIVHELGWGKINGFQKGLWFKNY